MFYDFADNDCLFELRVLSLRTKFCFNWFSRFHMSYGQSVFGFLIGLYCLIDYL